MTRTQTRTKTDIEVRLLDLSKVDVVFFYNHAGWCYDPATETAEEGRWRCARALAGAEAWAKSEGLDFSWVDDWGVDHEKEYECYSDGGPTTCETCHCEKGDVLLASLSCVDDADANYRRVIEAELADEALHEVLEDFRRRQERMAALRHIPEWSVVRLDDGRVGVKGRWGVRGKALVTVGELGVELSKDDRVEVLAYPADTAAAWVRRAAQVDL
jgi:hypothetical protein